MKVKTLIMELLNNTSPEAEIDIEFNKTLLPDMVRFLEPVANDTQEILSENVAVSHKYRQVKIAPNAEITIDLEDIKKEIEQSIAKQAGLYGDFFKSCT